MSYAILGVGAVGGLYGGLLAQAGFDVHFVARSDVDHMRQHGLRVESPLGDFHLREVQVYGAAQEIPQVDCAVVCWKSTDNHHLSELLPRVCGPESIVLVLQNGLDVERAAADLVGADRVLGGCCFLCSNKIGPGHIRHLDYGRIAFGEYAPAGHLSGVARITSRMQRIAADFMAAGIEIAAQENLHEVRWKKLAWNIPFNGLSVVLNSDTEAIMNNPLVRQLAEELMIEVAASAAACGVQVTREHIDQMLEYTQNMVPYASSMLLDYQAKRPLELEAIFGNPIRFAQAGGYQPARIDMLYRQLSFLDSRNRK
ncbi:MAG: putative 2-dehydropantoate 2-reductase [Pirellulaceae bacterium]|nr:putative 2-dehydropantoate 2-reductase [Pirellulaceae bacterium]